MPRFEIYSPLDSWKMGEHPVSPFVSIEIREPIERGEEGYLLVSPHLMTDKEVDDEVDKLIRELEACRKAAKRKLESLQARMLKK